MQPAINSQRAEFEFLRMEELARLLRVTSATIYRLVARRTIPVYRVCRKLLFRRGDVLRYINARRQDPHDPDLWL